MNKDTRNALLGLAGIILIGAAVAFFIVSQRSTPQTELKTTSYTNSGESHFKLQFYAPYGTEKLKSGNTQLVSKVGIAGKFPVALSISSGDTTGFDKVKNCGDYKKVFDVQNSHLKQKIAVCDLLAGEKSGGKDAGGMVYVAGFTYNKQPHLITISQDYSGVDLSNKSDAKKTTAQFGLEAYNADLKRIIASIEVK